MKIKPLLLSIITVLTGCAINSEQYSQPPAPIPHNLPATTSNSEQAVILPWREFFNDERLHKLIETALNNNRDLRLASLNVERVRALHRIQHSEFFPRVEANSGTLRKYTPDDLSGNGRANTTDQYNINVGITAWEIDFFGRLRALEQRALAEYLATEQAQRAAQILLIAEVVNSYLTLIANREKLNLAQATLAAQQTSYHLIKRRFEVGLTPELDLRQTETRVESARVEVASFSALVVQNENALNLLLGTPLVNDALPNQLSAIKQFAKIAPGTSSAILLKRPDILQAENLLKAAHANIEAARTALFPKITLTSALGFASTELFDLLQFSALSWNYASQISLPIFDMRAHTALAVTKAEREIALTKYERAIQGAFRDVADVLAQQKTLDAQLTAQQALVNASSEVHRLAKARYEKGTDTYLSVLDAQRSLYSAQQQLIIINLAKFTNQTRLYAALGGGV